jgi:hypothetical protein
MATVCGSFPAMPLGATPPRLFMTCGCNILWPEFFVSPIIPFVKQFRMDSREVSLSNNRAFADAVRTLAAVNPSDNSRFETMTALAYPPDLPV